MLAIRQELARAAIHDEGHKTLERQAVVAVAEVDECRRTMTSVDRGYWQAGSATRVDELGVPAQAAVRPEARLEAQEPVLALALVERRRKRGRYFQLEDQVALVRLHWPVHLLEPVLHWA